MWGGMQRTGRDSTLVTWGAAENLHHASTPLCRKSPLLAQRTREKWDTRIFISFGWPKGPCALRAGSGHGGGRTQGKAHLPAGYGMEAIEPFGPTSSAPPSG